MHSAVGRFKNDSVTASVYTENIKKKGMVKIMKKRFLSSMLALCMAASTFGGFSISASAEPLEGVEYSIDFSTWAEGDYTVESIADAAKGSGLTVSDAYPNADTMAYSVVKDSTLGTNVLKLSSSATSSSTADGLEFTADGSMSGKNVTYFVKNRTDSTMASYGLESKYVYNISGSTMLSGYIGLKTNSLYYDGSAKKLTGFDPKNWLEETAIFNTDSQQFMYITDVNGRLSVNNSYTLKARNKGAVVKSRMYSQKTLDSYVSEVGFRTYPTVIDTAIYSGGEEIAEGGTVSTSLASLDVVFDHYMDETTMKAENIKLYNKTTESFEDFEGSISYDADEFTLTIQTGKLNANSEYDIVLTGGIANTDNIALKETKIAITTGAAGFEFASFKITDSKGNDLGTQKVVASVAANAVFETNNPVAGVTVKINGVEADYTKSEDDKFVIVPVAFENDKEYTIEFTNITDTSANTMEDMTFTVTTNEISKDYFVNDFDYITEEAGTMLNAADLLPEGTSVTVAPGSADIDGIFEVVDDNGDKAIKVSQPENSRDVRGMMYTFENDLFTLLGNENVVVELDYSVDNTTVSTYAALARMNNTACLYVCNNELIQQTIGTVASGINGKDIHYTMVLNSNGTMNIYANGERLSYNGSYDIAFRVPKNKPTKWEMYIQKGAAASYEIDNMRIRNYPEAMISFENDKGVSYDSTKVVPSANSVIYVTFDNIMNENSIREDSFSLYDSEGNEIKCTVSEYDAYERRVAITPADALEMGKSYEVRIDEGVANSQNRQLKKNVYTFETINVAPVKIENIKVADYNKIEIELSDYIDETAFTNKDVKVGNFDVTKVVVDRNPENYAKHKVTVTIDGVLDVGEGTVEITGGFDRYSRAISGLSGTYTAEDKIYISSVDFTLTEETTTPKISVAVLGGSEIDGVAVGGAYFEDKTTLKSVSFEENGVVAGDIAQVTSGELETALSGYVEVYVWNSLSDMVPLCEKVRVMKALTVHIAGDSKVAEYDTATRYPQQGWGHYLADYLIASAKVHNRAQSGTTSTTFRTGKIVKDSENPDEIVYSDYKPWEKIVEIIQPGDYVIIDLAHNDKFGSGSGANDIDSYKENIRGFVDEIRNDYNAIPILMSTVPTLKYETNALADYGQAMYEVAEEKGTIFLDVNTVAWSLFEEMGLDNARDAFYMSNRALKEIYNMSDDEIAAYPNSNLQNNGADLIHFSWGGAKSVAEIVAKELKKCDDGIALYVK